MIRVKDLPDSGDKRGLILHCPGCWNDYSACRGDYFMLGKEEVMECGECETPLELVTKQTVYKVVKR